MNHGPHNTTDLITIGGDPAFRYSHQVPGLKATEALMGRHCPPTLSQSSRNPSLDSMTTDRSTSSRQENAQLALKYTPPIPPRYKNMRTNFFILSMLLNGNPACVNQDLTFATHLSSASTALLNRAMQGIPGINEIWTTGRDTLLPAQPWVLWTFVIQELCKAVICLLSRKSSEVLLLPVHPLKPVDCTLLEWEHHPSYTKWMSPYPSNLPVDVLPLLENYATSLKAAMGLLMIYVARIFGPVSVSSGDFNILGYRDPDLPADAPRNLNFGDPKVTVKNSPGIFIYEAGINVMETCKALEVDKYDKMADELRQTVVEAIFSNITHLYPEKMQADLIDIEQRIVLPVEKPHALRATASEFHPGHSSGPTIDGAVCRSPLPDTFRSPSRLPCPSVPLRTEYRNPQPTRTHIDRQSPPSATTRLTVQHTECPAESQNLQGYTSPAYSAQAEPRPQSPPTTTTSIDVNLLKSATVQSGFQVAPTFGGHPTLSASPTFSPGFQIPEALNAHLLASMADPRLQISQAAVIHSEEQLFHECRRTAQRLLGLPISPNLPSPLGFWPPPASWYYPPATDVNPGPISIFQNLSMPNLPVYWPSTLAGNGISLQGLSGQEACQQFQTLFSLFNSSSQILNTSSSIIPPPPPDVHIPGIARFPDPQSGSTPEVQPAEPTASLFPTDGQVPAFPSNSEPPQYHPVRGQRRSRHSNRDDMVHSRPLALHVDNFRGHSWGLENP